MSAEIKTFPGVEFIDQNVDEQPQPAVIELIEQALEQAETGELQAIALVSLVNGKVFVDYSTGNGPHMHTLVAGVTELQFNMMRDMYEPLEDGEEDTAG